MLHPQPINRPYESAGGYDYRLKRETPVMRVFLFGSSESGVETHVFAQKTTNAAIPNTWASITCLNESALYIIIASENILFIPLQDVMYPKTHIGEDDLKNDGRVEMGF